MAEAKLPRSVPMNHKTFLLLAAACALAGCDLLQGDKVEVSGNVAANASGNASATAPSSAGLTSSRSLAGLTGGGISGDGGKDPNAIPAGAGQGVIDPRLVGSWTDTGDCKAVMELRPDGTFLAANGLVGTWRVAGGTLNFTANGENIPLRLDSIEQDRIVTTNAEGNTGPSTRC